MSAAKCRTIPKIRSQTLLYSFLYKQIHTHTHSHSFHYWWWSMLTLSTAHNLSPTPITTSLCLSGSNEMKGKKTIEYLTFDSPNNLFSDYQFFLFHSLAMYFFARARSHILQFPPAFWVFSHFHLFYAYKHILWLQRCLIKENENSKKPNQFCYAHNRLHWNRFFSMKILWKRMLLKETQTEAKPLSKCWCNFHVSCNSKNKIAKTKCLECFLNQRFLL